MKPLTFLLLLVLGTLALFLWGHSGGVFNPPPTSVQAAPVSLPIFESDRPDAEGEPRETAEGLPVPIYPGTRVTEAEIRPPTPSRPVRRSSAPSAEAKASAPSSSQRSIAGRLSATEERARADAQLQLEREVVDWISPEVPPAGSFVNPKTNLPDLAPTRLPYHWRVPPSLIDTMIREVRIKPVVRDYGTVYEATIVADFSAENRAAIIAAYQRDLVAHRLAILAGVIAFLLTCLAALAGYIRADEATRGYYTHWLRAVAAAGVGASGVLIYQLLRW